jgi:hypothetical protein
LRAKRKRRVAAAPREGCRGRDQWSVCRCVSRVRIRVVGTEADLEDGVIVVGPGQNQCDVCKDNGERFGTLETDPNPFVH